MNRPAMRRREGSPEYWVEALEKLRQSVSNIAQDAYNVWSEARIELKSAADEILPSTGLGGLVLTGRLLEAYLWASNTQSVGVDSSRTRPLRLGFRYVSLVSGAAVSTTGPGEVLFLRVEPVVLPDEGEHEGFMIELELRMFGLEAAALKTASTAGPRLVFLDGPIVDPPSMYEAASKHGLASSYEEYIDQRAEAVRQLAGQGGLVVGFVKRLRGRLFWAQLYEHLGKPQWMERVNDHFLGALIASSIRGDLARSSCRETGMILATRPFELDPARVRDYTLYLERGLRIVTALIVPGFCHGNHRPARIEVAVPEDGDPEWEILRAAAAVEAHLLEGAWLPAPVLAAHKACTIRGRESLRLLREAGSIYAREMLESLGGGEMVAGLYGLFD